MESTQKKNPGGMGMWPFSSMSLETAARIFDVANWFLLASLLIGVVSTFVIVRTVNIKELHWEEDRRNSAERIANLAVSVAEANARAAEANEKAEKEQLARIKIEERLAPRSISADEFADIVKDLAKFANAPIAVWQTGDAPEIGAVSTVVFMALEQAHWNANRWVWTGIGPVVGLVLIVQPGSDSRVVEAADALAKSLATVRLPCQKIEWQGDWKTAGGMHNGPTAPGPTVAPIRLIIGAKP